LAEIWGPVGVGGERRAKKRRNGKKNGVLEHRREEGCDRSKPKLQEKKRISPVERPPFISRLGTIPEKGREGKKEGPVPEGTAEESLDNTKGGKGVTPKKRKRGQSFIRATLRKSEKRGIKVCGKLGCVEIITQRVSLNGYL